MRISVSVLLLSTLLSSVGASSPSSPSSSTTAATSTPSSSAAQSSTFSDLSRRSNKPPETTTALPQSGTTATLGQASPQNFPPAVMSSTANTAPSADTKAGGLPDGVKLLIGAGGIYAAFLYYGSLQEDVFRYTAPDGSSFKQAWFLQVMEALANVVIGWLGMQWSGATKGIPLRMFGISGAAQVSAKACTSLALANGLSFPVATLAKSGKMAPVMLGSLLLGGASYELREYLQVAAIIGGTAVVSMGKKKGSGASSLMGVAYILLSLVLDGVTAGFQKRLKTEAAKLGVKPKPYDYMFWTNLFMCLTAAVIAVGSGELQSGLSFLQANPEILSKVGKFALCSAVGQSFIFFTIAAFDPLVLSTVTTTRKIFSVLLSILLKGHSLSFVGWGGIGMASAGILSELHAKSSASRKKEGHSKEG